MRKRHAVRLFLLLCSFMTFMKANAGAEEQYIVYLKPGASLFSASQKHTGKRYTLMNKDELSACLSEGIVEFYEPDHEITLLNDTVAESAEQWNLEAINASKAWDIGCFGNDIRVAVIDSGVYNHPGLEGNITAGYNYIKNNNDTADNIGHGTYVSGIIAAGSNNTYITGISPRAKIIPLKCFDKGETTLTSMISDAIYDAVDVFCADVINMSIGMEEEQTTQTLRLAVEYALENGCILTAAVGNNGNATVYYPANYDGVIGVGSVDSDLRVSSFSQRNSTVDVVAPGRGVESVSIAGYGSKSGTSFSCPHVSAMAAVAKCIDKNISASAFYRILRETSSDLGEEGYDINYGYGLIDIERMIDKMLENTPVFISPVDETADKAEITVYNNQQTPLNAVGLAALYEDGFFRSINAGDIALGAKQTAKITQDKGNVRFMLWNGFSDMKPLAEGREYTER